MDEKRKYIGIPGGRYRTRMRLVSAGGLDAFSQFILDHVLTKEDKISVLLESFGLPRGVIEDALTELLEANRVSLDVVSGKITKSSVRPDRREYRVDPPFDVWQDESTGAILPLSMVRHLAKQPSLQDVELLWLPAPRSTRDLLDLPAARALGSLLSADPTLRADRGNWIAEGLVNIEKIGPFNLYLPIDQVEVDGKEIEFVSGKGLPSWVTRSWSFELATSELSGESPKPILIEQEKIRTIVEEVTSIRDLEITTEILDLANLSHVLEGWRKVFDESLLSVAEFARQRNTFALEHVKFKARDKNADLRDRILSSGYIRFENSNTSHLGELWAGAKSYILIALTTLSVETLDDIWSKTEGNKVSPVHIILLDCSCQKTPPKVDDWLKTHAERNLGGEVVLIRTETPIESDLCLVDGKFGLEVCDHYWLVSWWSWFREEHSCNTSLLQFQTR